VNSVFPKLAVYNSVDPSVAPSLLMVSMPSATALTLAAPPYFYVDVPYT
jgi:hypothetical protein